jgi:hypothetical protein
MADEHGRDKLPVTAEVGGEGGSYADPTVQVATFEGDVPRSSETVTDAPDVPEAEPAPRMRRDTTE